MAEEKKMKRCPVSLQPDIEDVLRWDFSADDFASASQEEKADFIAESLSKRINQIVTEQRDEDGK